MRCRSPRKASRPAVPAARTRPITSRMIGSQPMAGCAMLTFPAEAPAEAAAAGTAAAGAAAQESATTMAHSPSRARDRHMPIPAASPCRAGEIGYLILRRARPRPVIQGLFLGGEPEDPQRGDGDLGRRLQAVPGLRH